MNTIFLLYTKIIKKISHYKIENDESAEITSFISMIYNWILGGWKNFFLKAKILLAMNTTFLKMSGYFSSRRHGFDCFESSWKGCFHLPSIHPFHSRLLPANCLPPLCHSVCCLTSETESLYTALLSVLVRSAVSVCVSVSVWYSVSKRGCLFVSPHVCACARARVHSRGNGWRLQLILAMWHLANLISLACSGQRAQIDAVCVCACVCAHVRSSGTGRIHHSVWWFQWWYWRKKKEKGEKVCVCSRARTSMCARCNKISWRSSFVPSQERPQNQLNCPTLQLTATINIANTTRNRLHTGMFEVWGSVNTWCGSSHDASVHWGGGHLWQPAPAEATGDSESWLSALNPPLCWQQRLVDFGNKQWCALNAAGGRSAFPRTHLLGLFNVSRVYRFRFLCDNHLRQS